MKAVFIGAALLFLAIGVRAQETASTAGNVHTFTMTTIDGKDVQLSEYEGKVLLLVNTASKCGFTPQYAGLQALYEKYHDAGLRILAFPANNFGGQEPGSNAEIKEFCSSTYGVGFDMFSKISVKGEDMHPLYYYLTKESAFKGSIKWNFTKFLVNGDGEVIARFDTRIDPLDPQVLAAIDKALGK